MPILLRSVELVSHDRTKIQNQIDPEMQMSDPVAQASACVVFSQGCRVQNHTGWSLCYAIPCPTWWL